MYIDIHLHQPSEQDQIVFFAPVDLYQSCTGFRRGPGKFRASNKRIRTHSESCCLLLPTAGYSGMFQPQLSDVPSR